MRPKTPTTPPVITLTTDFGLSDHYVACMKGVILQLAPGATVIDVTHEIPPHNILAGAFILRRIIDWFPPHTVHVVVVDPGVGGDRRIIAARFVGQLVIAPDNGLITFLHRQYPAQGVRIVQNPAYTLPEPSATFHGRDILVPTAARLAAGAPLEDVGPLTDHVEILKTPERRWTASDFLEGAILHTDHFGNLITNLEAKDVEVVLRRHPHAEVHLEGARIGPVRQTYADATPGEVLAVVGSAGLLEISVNTSSAARRFHPAPDAVVEIR